MSNVSIFEKNWTDLVFEDKNKAYGAYQLRQEHPRTTLLAFIIGVLFMLSIIGSWLLLSSFGNKADDGGIVSCPVGPTIVPIDLTPPDETEPFRPKTKQPETEPQSPMEPLNNAPLAVAPTNVADNNVPTNSERDNQPENTGNTNGTGTEVPTSSGPSGPAAPTAPSNTNGTVETRELDRLPMYPGGMDKFYEYIGKNFEKPDVDDHLSSITVIMSFVIEKDGSMSEIKVLRSADKNVEREAIRVLKSMKLKWTPGYKDNEKMRTLYRLPIRVNL